jgi:hypothetical protein
MFFLLALKQRSMYNAAVFDVGVGAPHFETISLNVANEI